MQSLPILDADGGCLAQKWDRLSQQGLNLQPLPVPQTPLAGWRVLNQQSIPTISERIPIISNGNMYQYLSCGEKQSTTFRALYKGYNHWASGRVEKIEININNPSYCFVRCCVVPSMKAGVYKVNLLLRKDSAGYGEIQTASCQCAAG